jgi:hypothetical protein
MGSVAEQAFAAWTRSFVTSAGANDLGGAARMQATYRDHARIPAEEEIATAGEYDIIRL